MKDNTLDIIHNTSRQPKLSVIIPLYNKAPYVKKALESVFAQTYTDFELIIVDDGSTDDSAAIAEKCLHTSHLSPLAFRLLKQKNAGISAARNNGFSVSSGEYIAFLDADDWWKPTYLERMAQLIEDYPEAGLYACNYVYYKPGKTHVALNIPTGYINYSKAYYEGGAMPVWTGAAIMPRVVFDEMEGFPVGIKLGEDFLLWAKTALHYPVAFLNEALAYYNNDVPVVLRATRNLHHPNNHMLFRMELAFGDGEILNQQHQQQKLTTIPRATTQRAAGEIKLTTVQDWNRLIDKLRVVGLQEYWLSKEYHDLAAHELAKVDWSQQPDSVKRIYKTPIWMLKMKRQAMKWGSWCKQLIIRLKVRDYRQGI